LAQTRVIDQRARRALHDDVLPRLHAAMLTLSSGQARSDSRFLEAVATLGHVHRQLADLLREMPAANAPEVVRLGLISALRQVVESELGGAFDKVVWRVEPEAERAMQTVPSLTSEVLFYAAREAVRNAARHGRDRDGRPLRLSIGVGWRARPADSEFGATAGSEHTGLAITIEDDGVGMETTQGPSGDGGQGLALHSTMMAVIGGTLEVESAAGSYTRISLILPVGAW
jgi:signal transduction histidine kinase